MLFSVLLISLECDKNVLNYWGHFFLLLVHNVDPHSLQNHQRANVEFTASSKQSSNYRKCIKSNVEILEHVCLHISNMLNEWRLSNISGCLCSNDIFKELKDVVSVLKELGLYESNIPKNIYQRVTNFFRLLRTNFSNPQITMDPCRAI